MDTPRFYFTDTFREFRPLLEKYSTKKKCFEKGSMIFSSAKPLDFCLYIDSGLISYSVLHESGAEKTLFYHGVGNLFPTYQSPRQYKICELGEMSYPCGSNGHPADKFETSDANKSGFR